MSENLDYLKEITSESNINKLSFEEEGQLRDYCVAIVPKLADKLALLERKLAKAIEQRDTYIDIYVGEFHSGPESFEDKLLSVIEYNNKKIEELGAIDRELK